MSIENIPEEGRNIAASVSCIDYMVELGRTDHSVKFRLMIDMNLFIQVYTNSQSGRTNFVAISGGQRIFGRDSEGAGWHKHPFENPVEHDFSSDGSRQVTLTEFVIEVEDLLLREHFL